MLFEVLLFASQYTHILAGFCNLKSDQEAKEQVSNRKKVDMIVTQVLSMVDNTFFSGKDGFLPATGI